MSLLCSIKQNRPQQWLSGTARARGQRFDPELRHTKEVIIMVPDASLLSV